ncbi:MAG TPA: crotonase/enoyl-CoA hydratase family protein [Burkholderiales bacterium]|nr:crotonase/enoyl-CoA hydratase family protein [Burkholderiales bacterium]
MSNMNDAVGLRIQYGQPGTQLETQFEPSSGTIWGYMNPKGAPCFNPGLLHDIRQHDAALEANGGRVCIGGEWMQARYYVGASRAPGVYNLGGDLALFMLLIRAGERRALENYAARCIDNLHARIVNYGCPSLTTIALVQGDALGGGFECALTSDVIVAERSAQMGLPEIMFNLFPGMGAYQLLARRIGIRAAEEMILSGRLYSAQKLHEMGVVDVLAEDGQGEAAVQQWISANRRRQNGSQAVYRLRQIVNPITRAELDQVVATWVDAALRLTERDLKMMSWLVRAQQQRTAEASAAPAQEAPASLPQPVAGAESLALAV